MHPGDRYPGGPELTQTRDAVPPADPALPADPGQPTDPRPRRDARRWWAAAAWAAGGLALFAFFLRISLGSRIDSDGANNALQAWDLLHGHVLLHGWVIGDATFYFLELPLLGIAELLFGMGTLALHVASALTYLIVAVLAAALAVTGSRGPARPARCAVVIAVLAAPLLTPYVTLLLLEEPDHIGTCAFLLASVLLIDRVPGRRCTAPMLCTILCAGQLSDMTVRYVAVPAIVLVCAYRALATRRLRSAEAALAVAAAASAPLESLLRVAMVHLGAYVMVAPAVALAPVRLWPQHAAVAWLNVRTLFGVVTTSGTGPGGVGAAFGLICLLLAMVGLMRVAWTWRTARPAEQLLGVAIVLNIAVYVVSVIATPHHAREIVAVLPCGAVLAARACVPARIVPRRMAGARLTITATALTATALTATVLTATGLAALVPLSVAATQPPLAPAAAPLAGWLEAHGLTYGLAGYWDASVLTVQSGGRVKVRAVDLAGNRKAFIPGWEANARWYNPARYDATFIVADRQGSDSSAAFEQRFGRPAATYHVAGWLVLSYQANLLQQLA